MAPEVMVGTPNGGEVWYVGINYGITWMLANVSQGQQYPTNISYSITGLHGAFTKITNLSSRRGPNEYRWLVPNTPTLQAAVKIEVIVGNATFNDTSNNLFEIRSVPPSDSVVVIVPNGGEVYNVNQRVMVRWIANISKGLPYNVTIDYSTTGPSGPWIFIANVTQQQMDGAYNWRVPNTPTKNAYVRVTELSSTESDMSNAAFEIAGNPSAPMVKVVTPNGGEVLNAGLLYNITWNLTLPYGQGIPTAISYSTTGINGTYALIARTPSNRGMNGFIWVVNNTPTKDAAVKVVVGQGGLTIQDVSDNVFEIVGIPPNATLDHVMIIPKSATIEQTKTLQFAAKAFDKSGKEITAGVMYVWRTSGGIGPISPTGLFTAQNVGTGQVNVTGTYLGEHRSDTASVTVIPQGGAVTLDHVQIAPRSATVISTKTLQFSAKAFDQYNNEIPPQSMSYAWSVSNSIGTVDQSGLFTGQNAGNGLVTTAGTYGGVTKSDSANVTVIPANATIELSKVMVSPKSVTVKVGNVQKFNARAVDQFGNDIPPQMVKFTWSTTGGIGIVDPNGLFTAQSVGQGSVMVEGAMGSATKSDTASVTVVAQNVTITLTKATIDPKIASVKLGDKFKFTGKAFDQFDNEMPQGIAFTWSVTGNIGDVDLMGLFTAKTVGTGNVIVTATQGTISKSDLAQVTVTQGGGQGQLRVVITPTDIALTVDNTQQFTAKAYDKDGNEITQGVTFTWSVNGTIGTINATGFFTAKIEGKGSVVVQAQYGGLTATNSTSVTVKASGTSGGTSGISNSDIALIIGIVAAAVVLTLLLLWLRKRQSKRPKDLPTDDAKGSKAKKG
jgi:hypothetical protein